MPTVEELQRRITQLKIGTRTPEGEKFRQSTIAGLEKQITAQTPAEVEEKVTGIRLPAQPDEKIGDVDISLGDLLVTSRAAIDRAGIERELEAGRAHGRRVIESRFGQRITEFKEQAAEEKRALGGQFAIARRFSSSAQAFIKFVEETNNKKIASLEIQLEDALNAFDFNTVSLVQQSIATAKRDAQQEFENMFRIMQFAEGRQTADELEALANRDGAIADLFSAGVTDLRDIQSALEEAGFRGTRLSDVSDVISMLEKIGDDLKGASTDLKTFALLFPEFEVGTPEFRTAFNRFIAQQAAFKRKPTDRDGEDEPVADIPTFEEFVNEFIGTPEGQQLVRRIEQDILSREGLGAEITEERVLAEFREQIRDLFDETVKESGGGIEAAEFSPTQRLKLERAGLLNAPRQEQLDFLFDKRGGDDETVITNKDFLRALGLSDQEIDKLLGT